MSCERCPLGFYRNIDDDGTTPTSSCTRCPGSSTTASDGSPNPSSCVGKYNDNMPMLYTTIFHSCKNDNFQKNNCDIFLIFALNIDSGHT